MTTYATKLTYCTKPNSTVDLKVKEFTGKDHVQQAQAFLAAVAGEGKPASHYHVFETVLRDTE